MDAGELGNPRFGGKIFQQLRARAGVCNVHLSDVHREEIDAGNKHHGMIGVQQRHRSPEELG